MSFFGTSKKCDVLELSLLVFFSKVYGFFNYAQHKKK